MKVLAIIPGSDSGNSMIFARRQVEAIRSCGTSVQICYLRFGPNLPNLVRELFSLKRKLKEFKPDLVHAQYGTATAFVAVTLSQCPVVVTYRGSDLNPVPSASFLHTMVSHALSHIAACKAAAIVCVSNELRERLVCGKDYSVVIPTGVDTDIFSPSSMLGARRKLGLPLDVPMVLFNAGKSPKVKRADLAEAALAIARKSIPELQTLRLNGETPPEIIPLYHNAANVLLVTSDFEGSPTIVQEAIACGLPVVSVDVGDVCQRLKSVRPSAIVARDPEDIARGLLSVLACGGRSNGAGVAAREFSNVVTVSKLLNVFKSALKR